MKHVIGDATHEEAEVLLRLLRSIQSRLGDLESLTGTTFESARMETDVGIVEVHSQDDMTVLWIEPSNSASRLLSTLGIGDPERSPHVQIVVSEGAGGRGSGSTTPRETVTRRTAWAVLSLDVRLSHGTAKAEDAQRHLVDTAEAMAAWAVTKGEDVAGSVDVHAPTDIHPGSFLWCATLPADPSNHPTLAIEAWAKERLDPMIEISVTREKQTLNVRIEPAMRTGRCDIGIVDAMRILARHPDIPT